MGEKVYSLELKVADKILEDLKEEVIDILWYGENNAAFDERWLLPFAQEEASYDILKLNLSDDKKRDYLIKIENIMGPYGE